MHLYLPFNSKTSLRHIGKNNGARTKEDCERGILIALGFVSLHKPWVHLHVDCPSGVAVVGCIDFDFIGLMLSAMLSLHHVADANHTIR